MFGPLFVLDNYSGNMLTTRGILGVQKRRLFIERRLIDCTNVMFGLMFIRTKL